MSEDARGTFPPLSHPSVPQGDCETHQQWTARSRRKPCILCHLSPHILTPYATLEIRFDVKVGVRRNFKSIRSSFFCQNWSLEKMDHHCSIRRQNIFDLLRLCPLHLCSYWLKFIQINCLSLCIYTRHAGIARDTGWFKTKTGNKKGALFPVHISKTQNLLPLSHTFKSYA